MHTDTQIHAQTRCPFSHTHTVTVAALPYDGNGEQQNPDDIIILHLSRPCETPHEIRTVFFFCCLFLFPLGTAPQRRDGTGQEQARTHALTHARTHSLTHADTGQEEEYSVCLRQDQIRRRRILQNLLLSVRAAERSGVRSKQATDEDEGWLAAQQEKTLTTAGAATRHRFRSTLTHNDARRHARLDGQHCSARPWPISDDLAK